MGLDVSSVIQCLGPFNIKRAEEEQEGRLATAETVAATSCDPLPNWPPRRCHQSSKYRELIGAAGRCQTTSRRCSDRTHQALAGHGLAQMYAAFLRSVVTSSWRPLANWSMNVRVIVPGAPFSGTIRMLWVVPVWEDAVKLGLPLI